MKIPLSSIIPLTAGSITIVNFFFSLVPIANNAPDWFNLFLNGISSEFRFIVFMLFTLIASFSVVKLITFTDRTSSSPSSKMTFVGLLCVSFAWMVIFNIKIVALGNDISGFHFLAFFISSWLFSVFLSIKLHFDFKELGNKLYGDSSTFVWEIIDKGFCTPKYIRAIRFISFWFIIFLGGIFYKF